MRQRSCCRWAWVLCAQVRVESRVSENKRVQVWPVKSHRVVPRVSPGLECSISVSFCQEWLPLIKTSPPQVDVSLLAFSCWLFCERGAPHRQHTWNSNHLVLFTLCSFFVARSLLLIKIYLTRRSLFDKMRSDHFRVRHFYWFSTCDNLNKIQYQP